VVCEKILGGPGRVHRQLHRGPCEGGVPAWEEVGGGTLESLSEKALAALRELFFLHE
jgi:hypothetical protein